MKFKEIQKAEVQAVIFLSTGLEGKKWREKIKYIISLFWVARKQKLKVFADTHTHTAEKTHLPLSLLRQNRFSHQPRMKEHTTGSSGLNLKHKRAQPQRLRK